jgi:arsenate reductase (thioredoxin)
MTTHILILCTHNSARSILSEAMLNHWASRLDRDMRAHSAGSAASGRVNPLALEVLRDAGIATTGLRSKSWDEFTASDSPPLAAVITVCDSAAAETCPVFIGRAGEAPIRLHWGYPDPSNVAGDEAARRSAFELTRQAIGYRMLQLASLPIDTMQRGELAEALAAIGCN